VTARRIPVVRGLRREDAARYVGVSPSQFDRRMLAGRMPRPIVLGDVRIWDRFVKIGWSAAPESRRYSIENGLPLDLTTHALLTESSMKVERDLHRRFAQYRLRREWFRFEGELAEWIDAGCPLT
jgi:hypothetical protein